MIHRYMTLTEEIDLLRASAKLIADHVDPPWGLAHRLAELAEQKVITSGLPAASFGNHAENAKRLASVIGFLPECCPACGEWAGQHGRWCIHAEPAEDVAAASELLGWVDLSGLPPVHRRPNLRAE